MPILNISLGFWDVVLILVVTLQATAVAYLSDTRWKSLALTLPLPFTTIVLSLGKPIDASYVLSFVTLMIYVSSVRLLYIYARIPIVLSIIFSVLIYATIGSLLMPVVPHTDQAFWISVLCIFALGHFLRRILPHPSDSNYRTPLPLWQKLPIIFLIVLVIVTIKSSLQGFASLFPLLGTVGAYEVRHNLWVLVRTVPNLMCALIPLMIVVRMAQASVGLPGAFVLGWMVFLPILWWLQKPSYPPVPDVIK